ncbi:MAG: hypothetical protein J2P41_00080 [Blastocatellia bacterium]|nr:hypothetical protein [Blastocatellia bacterium]
MSAAIQLLNQPVTETESFDKQSDKQQNNVSVFEMAPEQRLRRALAYIKELQTEVRSLREELVQAERSVAHYQQLVRNAMLREQELRSQLVKEIQI